MTTPDLIAFLLRQAEISSSTDRGKVLAEAAGRLGSLAEDGARLDFVESARLRLSYDGPSGWWKASGPGLPVVIAQETARDAVDTAMRWKAFGDEEGPGR